MSLLQPYYSARRIYREYPGPFWTLAVVTFIDRLGGALIFPFFALYITSKFGVGMTEVGILFLLFSVPSVFGGLIGGALADRLGRKGVIVFSLVMTAGSTLLMGFIDSLQAFYVLAVLVGLLADVGGPAYQAVVADILPEEQRAGGFGLLRVIFNLAVVIGPAIGGLLATRSYLLLFIADAVASSITALVVILFLPETKPQRISPRAGESLVRTFAGYGVPLRDATYVFFILACMLQGFVYLQMNSSLGVYLRDIHGLPARGYGLLLSLNAAMVVVMQFWITRRIEKRPPFQVMVAGTLLYAIGFGLYGPATTTTWFAIAMIILTIGEMLVSPVMQALVARMAPEDMRGRYMAVFGFAWVVPSALAPLMAGVVMDRSDPRLVWYAAFLIGLASAAMFRVLHRREVRSGAHAPAGAAPSGV
ncbi:MAG: MFS transporter [Chloroflexi bacterium]|nr:MFS transporter [Chloroflexota bacterium]